MTAQYTFVMKDLRKLVPPKREILKGIWLSFYPGAKIGVLGNNGAGKSTLLRIMAGVDKEFLGEAWPAPGLKIGYLPQEPQLDPAKDVKGNVEEGVEETRKLLTRFEELSMKLGEDMSPEKMEKLLEEQGRLQDQIEAASAAASRCAGCSSASPTCCCSTSRPTTSTPRASPGSSACSRSSRARSSRSPTIATSSTTSPSGSSS